MSNNHKNLVKQISLFEMIQQDSKDKNIIRSGSLNFQQEYAMVIKRCFTNSGLDVVVFATKMTELLNRGHPDDPTITHNMVYSWDSLAKTGYEPKPSWLPAFCKVAGSYEPIEFLSQKVGLYPMPGDDALKSEIQEFYELKKEIEEKIKERELYLKLKNKK